MLYWLLQSVDAHPALSSGQPPPDLLAEEELAQLDRLSSPSRRRDWLLGRWTAKRLLQQVAEQHAGYSVGLQQIIINTAPDGAPCTPFRQPLTGTSFSLSISHSHGYALCAVVEGHHRPLGVDLERVTARDPGFIAAFLSPEEQALLDHGWPASRRKDHLLDLHINALWSAKESVIKALRPRKRPELDAIHCHIRPVIREPQTWIPFSVTYPPALATTAHPPQLSGWWQTLGGFVLTMVTPANDRP